MLAFASMGVVVLLVLLQLTRLGFLVRSTIPDRPRRRMFIASVSFLITFLGVRLLVSLVIHNHGPFEWVMVRGLHIHHLVWGILILLLVGYGWLLDLGRSHSPLSIFFSRLMSVSYGAGAALTLDEFSLWLNLVEVWTRQHRCDHSVRRNPVRGRVGRALLPRTAVDVEQARLVSKRVGPALPYSPREVASST